MSGADFPHYYDPAELAVLGDAETLAVDLMADYLERRKAGASNLDLLGDFEARASEHGPLVHEALMNLIVAYEVARLIWPDEVAGTLAEGSMRDGHGSPER